MEIKINLVDYVNEIEKNAKAAIIKGISEILELKFNSFIRFKENVALKDYSQIVIKSLFRNQYGEIFANYNINGNIEKNSIKNADFNVIKAIAIILNDAKLVNPYYVWCAESNDGSYQEYNIGKTFETEKDAYEDMRNAALEKMKWNTEYDEDFDDIEDESYIGYEVEFYRNKIVHTSYSGVYTYQIKKIG